MESNLGFINLNSWSVRYLFGVFFFIGSFTKLFLANRVPFPDCDVEKTSSTCLENIKFFCQSRLKCSGIFIGNSEAVPTLILRWRFLFHFFEPRFHFQDGNHDGISLYWCSVLWFCFQQQGTYSTVHPSPLAPRHRLSFSLHFSPATRLWTDRTGRELTCEAAGYKITWKKSRSRVL